MKKGVRLMLVRIAMLSILSVLVCGIALTEEMPGNTANDGAAKEVASGQRTEANAAWWGFNTDDATDCLQAAIDSGAHKIRVPYMGADWIVRPIKLRGNQEIVFEPGVVVFAKKGHFKGGGDTLFSAKNLADIALRGYGAALRMRKRDYQSSEYSKAEWRTVLDFVGCSRINVEGLRLESSGGDGIYLGASDEQPYCQDVTIRNVVSDDNHRQGISVISAVNLLIENCTLSNTGGTAPQAGIDFEPNRPTEKLVNCVMRNCILEGNTGAGILVYLVNLSKTSENISISFEDCYVRGGKDTGIGIGAIKDDGPQGTIEFKNCTIENAAKGGLYLFDKSPDSARVRFVQCKWSNVGTLDVSSKKRAPLVCAQWRKKCAKELGGVDFLDCYLYDELDRPVLSMGQESGRTTIRDLQGVITARNPHGARMDLHGETVDVHLRAIETPDQTAPERPQK